MALCNPTVDCLDIIHVDTSPPLQAQGIQMNHVAKLVEYTNFPNPCAKVHLIQGVLK